MLTYVLYNPTAGGGTEAARRLESFWLGKPLRFLAIQRVTDYAAWFSMLKPEDALVICGGDGTLNRFCNDTAGIPLSNPLYYYPTGSGNDFWRDIGKKVGDPPCRIEPCLTSLPAVEVNGKRSVFLNGVGYGIDGYCCEQGDRQRAAGKLPVNYTSIAIRGLLWHYKPTNAVVTVDGVSHPFFGVWLAPCMKGRYYGGGMMPTPNQDRKNPEGTVSVMVMHGAGKLKTLAVFPSIFKGAHIRHTDMVSVLTGKEIHVAFDRPAPLQIDGETVSNVSEYRVSA